MSGRPNQEEAALILLMPYLYSVAAALGMVCFPPSGAQVPCRLASHWIIVVTAS